MAEAPVLYLGMLLYPVYALGPGERLGIWFAGCSLGCPGCMTPELWSRNPDQAWTPNQVRAWLDHLPTHPRAVTISGGEPFEQPRALAWLLELLRQRGVEDIWVYSGYTLEYLGPRFSELLAQIDVLIDGPYLAHRPTDLIWRGSENQRLHLLSPRAQQEHRRWVNYRTPQPVLQLIPTSRGIQVIGVPQGKDWLRLRQAWTQTLQKEQG